MAIISRLPQGAGGSSGISKILNLQGIPNETITIAYDGIVDNCLLDANGLNPYVLVCGKNGTNATLTGSISGHSKQIIVVDETEETIILEKVLLWKGKGNGVATTYLPQTAKDQGQHGTLIPATSQSDGSIQIGFPTGTSYWKAGSYYFNTEAVDFSKYSKLKVRINVENASVKNYGSFKLVNKYSDNYTSHTTQFMLSSAIVGSYADIEFDVNVSDKYNFFILGMCDTTSANIRLKIMNAYFV